MKHIAEGIRLLNGSAVLHIDLDLTLNGMTGKTKLMDELLATMEMNVEHKMS